MTLTASSGPTFYQTVSAYSRTAADIARDYTYGPDSRSGYRSVPLSHSELKHVIEMWLIQQSQFRCCLEFAEQFVDTFSKERVDSLIDAAKKSTDTTKVFWAFPFLVKVPDQFRVTQHSTMFIIDGETCEFFDSEGRALEFIPWKDNESIQDLGKYIFQRIHPTLPFTYKTPGGLHQPDKTSCGYFALHWLKYRLEGGTTENYIKLLEGLGTEKVATIRADICPLLKEANYYSQDNITLSNHMGFEELGLLLDAANAADPSCIGVDYGTNLTAMASSSTLVIPLLTEQKALTGIFLWNDGVLSYFDSQGIPLQERSETAYQHSREMYGALAGATAPFQLNEPLLNCSTLCLITAIYYLVVKKNDFEALKAIIRDSQQYSRVKIDAFLLTESHKRKTGTTSVNVDSTDDF